MRKATFNFLGILFAAALLVGCGADQPSAEEDAQELEAVIAYDQLGSVFAMADKDGSRLIIFSDSESAVALESLDAAIGSNNQYFPIQYAGEQTATEADTARVVAENFDNMGGYVFDIIEGDAIPNDTYFLVNSELVFEEGVLLSANAGSPSLNEAEKTAIGELKGRPVQEGWVLADYKDRGQLQLVVFETQGNEYLMSILFKDADGSYKFKDFPATNEDGYSVWRVDDDGTITPDAFTVRFSAVTDKGFVTAISWSAPEGESTFFLLEDGAELKEQPMVAYRYWSPF